LKDSLMDRLPDLLAKLPWQTCKDLEFRLHMDGVKLSPSFGIGSPRHIPRCQRNMPALSYTFRDSVRSAISRDGQICTEAHFFFSWINRASSR